MRKNISASNSVDSSVTKLDGNHTFIVNEERYPINL